MLGHETPVALYMEGELAGDRGKMAQGVLRYSQNPVVAVIDSSQIGEFLPKFTGVPKEVPIIGSVREAVEMGAKALIPAIAPPGGRFPLEWFSALDEAIELGLSLVNGLHERLLPRYPNLKPWQWIWDLRQEPEGLGVGTGAAANMKAKRVLMIGTDMSVGKMTAGLELLKSAREKGIDARFVATGQIGIVITGQGVPLDAVRVDYATGSIEREVLAHEGADLIIVEGQGALIHPGSTANLPLLRGSCPTHLILCVRTGQTHLRRAPHVAIPDLREYVELYKSLAAACGTFPTPELAGVACNTSSLGEDEAKAECRRLGDMFGVPCTDPVRYGASALV